MGLRRVNEEGGWEGYLPTFLPLTLRNVNSQHDLLLYPWHHIGCHPILACSYFLNPVR